jgi:uncharacterized protein
MQQRQIHTSGSQRTYAVVLETGQEAMKCLRSFAAAERVSAAQLTAIGAFENAVLMYFDWEKRDYLRNLVHEQVEVASMMRRNRRGARRRAIASRAPGGRQARRHCAGGTSR